MSITHFTVVQGNRTIGRAATVEQAVKAAKSHAAVTGKSVSVIAHRTDGRTQEAIFNPDGTNEKIWAIDRGQPLVPTVGQVYTNRGGGEYRCLALLTKTGTVYFNPFGGFSGTSGVFQNIKSGWTFTAKGIIQYSDGTIEWDHSTDGRFERVEKGE